MTVLVIRKPTNLEQHGDVVQSQAESGGLGNAQIKILRESHDEHYECLDRVRQKLQELAIPMMEIQRGDMRPDGNFRAIISVGGDGTLLSASHAVETDTPVIGIRSSKSSVGYLCAGGLEEVDSILDAFHQGTLTFQSRHRIYARVFKAEDRSEITTFPVLNDFLYTNSNPASTTRYKLTFKDKIEIQKSSGLWVATATGSTAAISAAGGETLDPIDDRLQFVVRELYLFDNQKNEVAKGYFDGEGDLEIENHCASGILALDGERGVIRLKYGDRLQFERGPVIRIAVAPK
ncbi:NAD(+)/NADH kinase [Pseudobacteriovorax antillogorgiicola]|uniref:NAD+ kinase n=1 Tax=Pseudobacteriovorax antillogorgiicola TaxID=1513793 RepID=A0A1Y6C1U4_9BACT|nr:NAD(+)/NADH kinase [Pseudobacteriovorax antillogorgiicola]TCS50187.1 NAD+ kinase [Pseudobacteriovorax antillogorgiicola]SMF32117.1 NAD+ kinase [Pseudobacteriovorax antillogorgiicola]